MISQSLSSAKRLHQEPEFLVYSLLTHKIIKKFAIPGILSFSANSNTIIIVSVLPVCQVSPHNLRLRARQIQLRSVSIHPVHLHPYLLSHRVFQPSRINHRQRQPRTPIPLYYHQTI
jgi:hypothetical protein